MKTSLQHRLTISRAASLLSTSRLSSQDLSLYCHALATHGETALNLNAFSYILSRESILDQAAASQERIDSGKRLSVLDGIPVSIKGNIAVKELPLTAGSAILNASDTNTDFQVDSSTGCGYDSYVAKQLLRRSGAVLIGLTHMDEFGMGSLGNNLAGSTDNFNFTRNPLYCQSRFDGRSETSLKHCNEGNFDEMWLERIRSILDTPDILHHESQDEMNGIRDPIFKSAGGSSSGSAASVSHGSSLASIGTDTGGSIRLPASWCGVVGMKPTYGAISRWGVVSYASSLDTVGIIANTVGCASLVLDRLVNRVGEEDSVRDATAVFFSKNSCLVGRQEWNEIFKSKSSSVVYPGVATSRDVIREEVLNSEIESSKPLIGIKVGIPSAFSVEECPSAVLKAWRCVAKALEDNGASVCIVPSTTLSPDAVQNSLPAYYVLACSEASSNLSRYDGLRYGINRVDEDSCVLNENLKEESNDDDASILSSMTPLECRYSTIRAQNFGEEVTRRVLCGTAVLSSDRFHTHYEAAAKVRATISKQLNDTFGAFGGNANNIRSNFSSSLMNEGKGDDSVDLMLVPTAIYGPPNLGPNEVPLDNTEAFANDIMTVPLSLAGLPSISLPIDVVSLDLDHSVKENNTKNWTESESEKVRGDTKNDKYNHPVVGIQIFGPKLSEELVMLTASVVEQHFSLK